MGLFTWIVAGVFFYYVINHPNILPHFGGGGGGGGSVSTGGGSFSGTHIYKTTGKTCSCSSGQQTIGCGGGHSPSKRVNCNNCGLQNYEATATVQFGGGCGCGDEATIKHYGPTHQDGNCCWSISNVQQNGQTFFGGEGPHSNNGTNKRQQSLGSLGNLAGKRVGIKSIIWKTSGGAHQELWVDPTGSGSNWKKMGAKDMSSWGNLKKSSSVAPNQQVEFRIDCSGATWSNFEVAEIVPGGGSGGSLGNTLPAGGTNKSTKGEAIPTKKSKSGRMIKRKAFRAMIYG